MINWEINWIGKVRGHRVPDRTSLPNFLLKSKSPHEKHLEWMFLILLGTGSITTHWKREKKGCF